MDDTDTGDRYIDGPERRRITEESYTDNPQPGDIEGRLDVEAGHEDEANWRDNADDPERFRNGPTDAPGLRG